MSTHDLVIQGDAGTTGLERLRALAHGAAIEPIGAGASRIAGADPDTRGAVSAWCEAASLDWGFVRSGARLADFGLLAIDMDSTLITVECIDEIADFAGRKAEVAAVTASAMRGEIDWASSLRRRVAALAGLPEEVLDRVWRERVVLQAGGERLVAAARAAGLRTLLVSGGFTFFTDRLRAQLDLDEAHSNVIVVEGGLLTGEVTGPLVDAQAKADHVRRLAGALGLARDRVLAIGDGANDLAMMAEAGTSIAFHAKPAVRQKATYAISRVGLEGVLALFPP